MRSASSVCRPFSSRAFLSYSSCVIRRIGSLEPELQQIERIDERVNHSNGIILANPVVQAFWKKCGLAAIQSFNKALHPVIPRISHGNHIVRVRSRAFLHSQSQSATWLVAFREAAFEPPAGHAQTPRRCFMSTRPGRA